MGEEQITVSLEKDLNEALISCEKCHLCNTVCPIVDTRMTQGPLGMNRAIYYGLKWKELGDTVRDLVHSCTTCGKCVAMCKKVSRALPLVEIFEKARALLLESGLGPLPDQREVLKNIYRRGNPWGYPPHERTKWADDLNIQFASKDNKVDVLYFVGCASSYDPHGQKIAQNLCRIFTQAGVNFGILEEEKCSGSEARRMGETGLFEYLTETNMEMFEEVGVNRIVTGDPHSFYSFCQEYPDKRNRLTVQHYSQFLNELLDSGKLKLSSKGEEKVTYHDPCYLGRHSEVFEEPRRLIQRIPGITFVEMENSKEDSDCCGMGGGRMWIEVPRGLVSSLAVAEKRVRQALDTGAEILLTACPFCNITLRDAVKSLEKEDTMKVMDITELISTRL